MELHKLHIIAPFGKTSVTLEIDNRCFFKCETKDCVFNNEGLCRYYAVYETFPDMTVEDGCSAETIVA